VLVFLLSFQEVLKGRFGEGVGGGVEGRGAEGWGVPFQPMQCHSHVFDFHFQWRRPQFSSGKIGRSISHLQALPFT